MDTLITSIIGDTVIVVAEKESWKFDGPIIIGIFAIIMSAITLYFTNRNIKEQIKSNTEIRFRQEWLDNVRNTFSEFNSYIRAIIFYNNVYGKETIQEQSDKLSTFSCYSQKLKTRYFKLKLLFNAGNDVHRYVNKKLDEIYEDMKDLYSFDASKMEQSQLDLTNLIQKILVKEWFEITKKQSKIDHIDNEIKEMIKTNNV